MASVNELYKFIQYISKKSQSGNLTPDGFNTSVKRAFYEWTIGKLGGINSQNKVVFQDTRKISDDVKFLLKKNDYYPVNSDGVLNIPPDFMYVNSIRYKYKTLSDDGTTTKFVERNVQIVEDTEIEGISDSQIFGPRIEAGKMAFASEYSTHIQIYPKNIGSVIFTYIRQPITPVWAFTLVNGRPVYNAAASTDLECAEVNVNDIAFIMCSYLGINLRENELIQYSEMKKQETNQQQ